MKRIRIAFGLVVFCLLAVSCLTAWADPSPSPYEVVWDSPSETSDGSMPLGNGEVALNAWIEPTGDLRFYIARTDSWDDNGRLVKVGAVRIRVGDGATERTKVFWQSLAVKSGMLSARYGQGDAQVELRLWVDAFRPVVCVEIQTAKPSEATALIELWRNAQETLPSVEVSDILCNRSTKKPEKTIVEPDTVLKNLADRIGWYHRNIKSVGPELCARIQGVADFSRPDPLLHRTFGALIATEHPLRVDDRTLRSKAGTSHRFEIYVHTQHPATAEQWLAETERGLDEARSLPWAERRAAHEKWWREFWERSWIHITSDEKAEQSIIEDRCLPANKLPIRIGLDQRGGSRFDGEFGRVGIYTLPLSDDQIERLAAKKPEETVAPNPDCVYSAVPKKPGDVPSLAECTFAGGVTLEAWLKPVAPPKGQGMRIVDKITVGGADGFLFDTHPGASLRLIAGRHTLHKADVLTAGQWNHVAATVRSDGSMRIFHNGKLVATSGNASDGGITDGDDAVVVTRAYALQRYVSACAGRGRYPIKFNGSLFTVPSQGAPGGPDYRRWGPGYWWQNTRLPYYSMCASGDFDLMGPLFQMYGRDLLPLFKFRTRRHVNHDGIYIPECIYFWGDMFTETYGWQPFEERSDKLQASRWHKWEWVSGLELAGLMLDYYEHTEDMGFLKQTAIPVAQEVLTFFDQHYKVGADGKLHMHPSQALETWWDCVGPTPEIAGLHSVATRLLALPKDLTSVQDRAFWKSFQAKLPEVPTTRSKDGKLMLAPAQEFKDKRNCENPELYAVFPFRLVALEKPDVALGVEALKHRTDRGAQGWRQDDVFMAYLGLADEAREYLVKRARKKHAASRFPVFWGPNYDWVPDQDHGSVLLKTVQAMLLQTDGRQILLLPAWPAGWNVHFKLHAPYQTIVSGQVEHGKLVRWEVEPESRRKDVKIWGQTP